MTVMIRPPRGVHSFTFNLGCGRPHEVSEDGLVDCEACVAHVIAMTPEQRIHDVQLRSPSMIASTGDQTLAQAEFDRREQRRIDHSWRLVESDSDLSEAVVEQDEKADLLDRLAALEAENQDLRRMQLQVTSGKGKKGKGFEDD